MIVLRAGGQEGRWSEACSRGVWCGWKRRCWRRQPFDNCAMLPRRTYSNWENARRYRRRFFNHCRQNQCFVNDGFVEIRFLFSSLMDIARCVEISNFHRELFDVTRKSALDFQIFLLRKLFENIERPFHTHSFNLSLLYSSDGAEWAIESWKITYFIHGLRLTASDLIEGCFALWK